MNDAWQERVKELPFSVKLVVVLPEGIAIRCKSATASAYNWHREAGVQTGWTL